MNNLAKIIAAMTAGGIAAMAFYSRLTRERKNYIESLQCETLELAPRQEISQHQVQQQTIDDAVIQAVIQIESNSNPDAQRYESHINDMSYGLMQLLTATAKELEKQHPELPRLGSNHAAVKSSLTNGKINIQYGKMLLQKELDFYGDIELAVAAYNAGHLAPRNARIQQQLNDLLGTSLAPDGVLGQKTKEVIKQFQIHYNSKHPEHKIAVDGILGQLTYEKIQQAWTEKYEDKENKKGIIPQNKTTPNHIEKFRNTLEKILRESR